MVYGNYCGNSRIRNVILELGELSIRKTTRASRTLREYPSTKNLKSMDCKEIPLRCHLQMIGAAEREYST